MSFPSVPHVKETNVEDADPMVCNRNIGISIGISVLNVNGWTLQNNCIRTAIVKHVQADIFCINESHLHNGENRNPNYSDEIEVNGYV